MTMSSSNYRAEINQLHSEIIAAALTSFEKAVRLGELLRDAKYQVGHGNWLKWVKANLVFSERTARNYLRIHANRSRLKSANVSDLADAYKLLTHRCEQNKAPTPETEECLEMIEQMIGVEFMVQAKLNQVLEALCTDSAAFTGEIYAETIALLKKKLALDETFFAKYDRPDFKATRKIAEAFSELMRGALGIIDTNLQIFGKLELPLPKGFRKFIELIHQQYEQEVIHAEQQ
jgi:hypothetical protein